MPLHLHIKHSLSFFWNIEHLEGQSYPEQNIPLKFPPLLGPLAVNPAMKEI